jgi:GNAT superfamily N-acetyltransferase
MEITAREARLEEKYIVRQLYEKAMKNHINTIWGWDPLWQENDFDHAFQTFDTYIIERASAFLGYFQIETSEDQNYLRMLILNSEERSVGIGAKVLGKILDITHENGKALTLRVFKVNIDAKRFYEREGWIVTSEEDAFFLMGHPFNSTEKKCNNLLQKPKKIYAFVVR